MATFAKRDFSQIILAALSAFFHNTNKWIYITKPVEEGLMHVIFKQIKMSRPILAHISCISCYGVSIRDYGFSIPGFGIRDWMLQSRAYFCDGDTVKIRLLNIILQ